MFKKMALLMAVLALTGNCLYAAPDVAADDDIAQVEQVGETTASVAEEEVLTVKQLRGKLLYRKGQARKMEKAAEAKDPSLKEKVDSLNAQIRALYEAANPKLVEVYKIQDDLQKQIDAAPKK